jgi:hypothetical protein
VKASRGVQLFHVASRDQPFIRVARDDLLFRGNKVGCTIPAIVADLFLAVYLDDLSIIYITPKRMIVSR